MIGYNHGIPVKQSLGAVATGEGTIVTGRDAAGFGRQIRGLGAYSFAAGRENTVGYAATATGRENTVLGVASCAAGGYQNFIDNAAIYGFIGGGQRNTL